MIDPTTARKMKDILLTFQDLPSNQDRVHVLVNDIFIKQDAAFVVKAFVYIVDNLARTQSQILSNNKTFNEADVTVNEVYAALYAAVGLYDGEMN